MSASVVAPAGITPQRLPSGALERVMLDVTGVAGNLVRRLVETGPGAAYTGTAGPAGELWYVISGTGELDLGGAAPVTALRPGRGVRVPPGARYRASGAGPLRLDAVALPGRAEASGPLAADLDDCPAELTGDRRFRVLFGPGRGCAAATQFVGEIPPGRAPEHRHAYDEVVLVLAGLGVVHAGADHPLGPGTCVHLPPGQPHCLENTGPATLVVLGVFHPGGSPAAKSR
jgi:mannose-6-phosphate isomerase-like protein (cupin superfamily)